MDNETEVIRQQMDETRASLAEKIETLENQVVGTVQETTTAVTETVDTVKETVQETVQTVKESMQEVVEGVKETFDLRLQTERHPWAVFGGSVALGYAAGYLWARAGSGPAVPGWVSGPAECPWSDGRSHDSYNYRLAEQPASAPRTESQGPGWLSEIGKTFQPEIQKLKGLAIGAALGLVRDMISRSLPPQMEPQLKEMMNNITTKLGGQPMQGPILEQFQGTSHQAEGDYARSYPAGTGV